MTLRRNKTNADQAKPALKQRMLREFLRLAFTFCYLAFFLGAFAWYRRFILDEYRISYFNYGAAFIEALILAKVVWLGELLGLGRKHEDKPLIYPTLNKALNFSILVGVFAIFEHMIGGVIHGVGVSGGLAKLWHEGKYELLARCLVTFFAFIPFFAFRELARVIGEARLGKLFLRKRELAEWSTPA
jgi:hypothetical protein